MFAPRGHSYENSGQWIVASGQQKTSCVPPNVIPAKAGIHWPGKNLDSRFRGSDGLVFMALDVAWQGHAELR